MVAVLEMVIPVHARDAANKAREDTARKHADPPR